MSSFPPPDGLITVPHDRAAEAAGALAEAFLREPVTSVFFPPEEGRRTESLRAMFEWAIDYRLRVGMPVLAVEDAGRIVGAATMRFPGQEALPRFAEEAWESVVRIAGPEAEARMEVYSEIQKRNLPASAHHFLVAIGTRPGAQGRGFGGRLLRGVQQVCLRDTSSSGVSLDTASDKNVEIYRRFGFEVYASEPFESVEIRFMFWPRSARLDSPGAP